MSSSEQGEKNENSSYGGTAGYTSKMAVSQYEAEAKGKALETLQAGPI